MDRTELAEHLAEVDADTPYYELLILDFDDRGAVWACNLCGTEITDGNRGCPTHAPVDIPGLYRVDCDTPGHGPVWVRDGDHTGYGVPCHQCMYKDVADELAKLRREDRCYHWPWRRWAATKWLTGKVYTSGLAAHGGGWRWGGGHDGCQDRLPGGWLRPRPYVLFVPSEVWRCWLIGHHRRGEHVGFGFCGKCVPWPCCGSQVAEHADGCAEDVRDAARAVTA